LKKTSLLYNPQAGQIYRRPALVEEAAARLRSHGWDVTLEPTAGPNMAGGLASRCIERGAEQIIVAGGDGTLNEAAEGVIGTEVPLGFLPAGTANVLAMEVRAGGNLLKAAEKLPDAVPARVAAGRITFADNSSRHFLLMAGAGLDASIVNQVSTKWKRRLGKLSYWIGGFSQLGSQLDEVDVTLNGEIRRASFVLVSRVRNYGGDLEIAYHADLLAGDFAVVLFSGRSSIPYLKYFSGVLLKRLDGMKGVSVTRATALDLAPVGGVNAPIQIDGEACGRVPARLEIVPDALTLLLPPRFVNQSEFRKLPNSVSNA